MIADLLAPPLCWACHGQVRRGESLCHACRRALRFLAPGPATVSGMPVWAPVAYEGPARHLVGALKFRGAARLVETMTSLIVAGAPPALLAGPLVPVPLHPARLRQRAFNQAALLAEAIGSRAGVAVHDILMRTGPNLRQMGRGRAARLAGPAGSFEASDRVPGRVVLVDDVVTTGATLAACATALRSAGAREVAALAFARTPGR